jgi:hypothetical protein
VTDSRTAVDFAACMRDLTDVHYPKLSGFGSSSTIYRPIRPARSTRLSRLARRRRVLERLEFHYVPKHASWLNMVESEIGVLRGQCLDRHIGTRQRLESEIAAWEPLRNAARSRIKWMFTIEKARTKMRRTYPCQADTRRSKIKES